MAEASEARDTGPGWGWLNPLKVLRSRLGEEPTPEHPVSNPPHDISILDYVLLLVHSYPLRVFDVEIFDSTHVRAMIRVLLW